MELGISIRPFLVRLGSAAALTLSGVGAPAIAQTVSEPAAIERTIPTQIREAIPAPAIADLRRDLPAEAPQTQRFTLGAVNIAGATVFSSEELGKLFEPYLASEVDSARLGEMAMRITDRYRDSGYLLSYARVPAQNVEAGMVRLAVVEGRIGEVDIEGAGPDQRAVDAIVAPLVGDGPLKAATLERAIGLIRDFPGLKVVDVALMRSQLDAGLFALKIKVSRNRVRAFSYLDNRGTDSIGRIRLYSSVSLSSVAIQGDEYRLDLFGMPGRGFHYLYGQVQAALPLGRSGLRLTLAASKGDQHLKSAERFDGNSTTLSAQLSYPMLRSRDLTIVAKVSVNDWSSLGRDDGVRQLRDRLRVARFGLQLSNEGKTRVHGDIVVSHGLDFDGMTEAGDPLASRSDASGRFTKLAFNLQVIRPLSDSLRLQTTISGQYSKRPLLSAEEFSLGGNRIGRAFDFNSLTGANGIGGGAELSYRLTSSKKFIKNMELFGFVDGGATFDTKSSAEAGRTRGLASVGIGTRFNYSDIAVSVEAGVPLAARGIDRSPRLFLSTYRAF